MRALQGRRRWVGEQGENIVVNTVFTCTFVFIYSFVLKKNQRPKPSSTTL